MNTTTLLTWYLPLEACESLEDICVRWPVLLESRHLRAGNEDPRYKDAVMAFLARSALPANLKLAATLACVNRFDMDLRLIIGVLDDALEDHTGELPVPATSILPGQGVAIECRDPWLSGFIQGRFAGLCDTLSNDHTPRDSWRRVFWGTYLVMSSRWADLTGVQLALENGADIAYDDYAAIVAAAEGLHSQGDRHLYYYTADRTNAQYQEIFSFLFTVGVTIEQVQKVVVPAAAAVDNTEMLEFFLEQGADIHVDNDAALVAAASHFCYSATSWLLKQGADIHTGKEAALLGAIQSLDVSMVEELIAAGADPQSDDELPLRTAFSAQPHDLYDGEANFIYHRADMIAVLLKAGARTNGRAVIEAFAQAPQAEEVLNAVLHSDGLEKDVATGFAAVARTALGGYFRA
jgi:hypothetical protein